MNKKKKIYIALILIFVFALCFIPSPKENYNCKYKLEIISNYGDNQAYHPKVLSFPDKWNGYKYWMSYTPYPSGNDIKENPHIAVSDDLINWITPPGLTNPLDNGGDTIHLLRYNSDSHLVFDSNNNTLYCYWRYVDDVENTSTIYRLQTTDGIHWSNKTITAYSTNRKKKDYISPAILYENHLFKMWYVDKDKCVKYATSVDGITWVDLEKITLKYEENLKTWHLDVIKTQKGYEMIVVAYDCWENHNNMNLYYTQSADGLVWDTAKVIIKPTVGTKRWDNKGIYRSSFIYENDYYYVFYGGTSENYKHGIGFMYGKDIFKLKKVNTNFKKSNEVNRLIQRLKV